MVMAQMSRTTNGATEYAYARILTNGDSPMYMSVEWHIGDEDMMDGQAVRYKGASNEQRLVSIPAQVVLPWIELFAIDNGDETYSYGAQFDDEKKDTDLLKGIRTERDTKLTACDWLVMKYRDQIEASITTDITSEEYQQWLTYRQELRDLPSDPELDLDNPTWPIEPIV